MTFGRGIGDGIRMNFQEIADCYKLRNDLNSDCGHLGLFLHGDMPSGRIESCRSDMQAVLRKERIPGMFKTVDAVCHSISRSGGLLEKIRDADNINAFIIGGYRREKIRPDEIITMEKRAQELVKRDFYPRDIFKKICADPNQPASGFLGDYYTNRAFYERTFEARADVTPENFEKIRLMLAEHGKFYCSYHDGEMVIRGETVSPGDIMPMQHTLIDTLNNFGMRDVIFDVSNTGSVGNGYRGTITCRGWEEAKGWFTDASNARRIARNDKMAFAPRSSTENDAAYERFCAKRGRPCQVTMKSKDPEPYLNRLSAAVGRPVFSNFDPDTHVQQEDPASMELSFC